jgi:iron complex outermembrane receptor protein
MPRECLTTHNLYVTTSLVAVISIYLVSAHPSLMTAQPLPDQKASNDSPVSAKVENRGPEPSDSTGGIFALLKDQEVSIDTKHLHPLTDSPSNVYVITDDDIRQSGAIDLPTILRRVPGLEIMQMSGSDFNVSARGNNQPAANKLLVLVDGRSIYEDTLGEVWWKSLPVTLPEIKRIEVLKGPASALYGFNAFDGVINIVTKSPAEMKGKTNGTLLQFGGGEFGTIMATAIQSGVHDKFGYRLSLGRDQTNDWRDRHALDFRSNKINLHTEYNVTQDSKLSVDGGFIGANKVDGLVVDVIREQTKINSGYGSATFESGTFWVQGSWTRWQTSSLEALHPNFNGFFVLSDRGGNPVQQLTRDQYNFQAQHAIEFGSSNRLTYGVQFRQNAASSNFLDDFTRENRLGIYIQDEWKLTRQFMLIAGLRHDLHSEINPTNSPRVAVVYKPSDDHSFRASVSVAYRPPTIFESRLESHGTVFPLGCPPNCFLAIPTVLRGSMDLKPEKITSYELGYQGWYLRHRLRLRAALFYNTISDLISSEGVAPDGSGTFFNVGKAEVYGGEAGVEFQATSWLSGYANYSFQELSQGEGDLVARNLTVQRGASRSKISAGLRTEWENGFSTNLDIHYVGSATYPVNSTFATIEGFGAPQAPNPRIGSYTLLNLRGAYRFWHEKTTGREAEIAVTAFNALNDQHREHPLGDTITSRVMGWLTIRY